MIKDNKDFYLKIDELIKRLNENGYTELSKQLYDAKSSGFMASEILGEISVVLQQIKSSVKNHSQLEKDTQYLLDYVNHVFNNT